MISEYEIEPIPGLPSELPPGERILWQGKPEWRRLARSAFHTRTVGAYFAALALAGAAFALPHAGDGVTAFAGAVITLGVGIVAVALLHVLAWIAARSTIYTLTNKRVVLRIGAALPKCINLPLTMIASAGLRTYEDGTGDMPLALSGPQRLGYVTLWPHARPWRLNIVEPMLRAVPKANEVAALLARTMAAEMGAEAAGPHVFAVAA